MATNVIGYSKVFGFKIQLGNFLLFLCGMLLGPLAGPLAGLLSDLTGLLISGGVPHFGFTLIKVMYGFLGALVFLPKQDKKIYFVLSIVGLMLTSVALHLLVITPLSFASYGGTTSTRQGLIVVKMIQRAILVPIEWASYSALVIACFEISWIVLRDNPKIEYQLWCARKGAPKFLSDKWEKNKVENIVQVENNQKLS
ncbi:folate family ECF transporter S component [Mycoplasma cottewii]|uniref:Folate family ECF transporter S component n=1 Tax=Mycoplasma cottewii TaxID=51364 RepID=A0ABY5TXW4_9MOLU|nr:folate family ECF transporter S component [Mycoplasma cottewii]UWD35430.1 folate family ECF transporter S component [Mycoplasma cottewii]